MARLFISLLFLLITTPAWATTWYVRDGGGSSTQCTGTTNAVYPGSGTAQPCALNSLSYVLGQNNPAGGTTSPLIVGGDTVNILGDSDTTPGTQAQYLVGYGMPGAVNCSNTDYHSYSCSLVSIPGGSDSSHMTKIIGTGTKKPQLWGEGGIDSVLSITHNNTDVENLEIANHSPCSYNGADPSGTVDGFSAVCITTSSGNGPYGAYAKHLIYLGGTNIITKNLFLHRSAKGTIVFTGVTSGWSSTNDIFVGSGGGDALSSNDSTTMSFAGNNTMTNDIWAFGGCSEHYPDVNSDPTSYLNYHHCADQTAGGFNLGGGFMNQNTSSACGNWTVNNTQFLDNIKTNWDFLHCDGTGTVNIYRSRSEGSSGEALKLTVAQVNVEESQLIGNAPVWTVLPLSSLWSPADINGSPLSPTQYLICRGNASTIFAISTGEQVNLINDDIIGNCTALVELKAPINQCTGSAVNTYNTKFIGGYAYDVTGQQVDLFYNGGSDGNGSGNCGPGAIPFNMTNDSCYNAKTYNSVGCTSGTNTVSSDPLVVGETNLGAFSSWLGSTGYYGGTNLGDQLYLQSSSPLKNAGSISGVTYTNGTSNDFNGVTANSPITVGALQYPSQAANNWFACFQNSDCTSNNCVLNVCTASGGGGGGIGDSYSGSITFQGITLK